LSLLAYVSAQSLCGATSDDLASTIVLDLAAVTRDLDLRVNADFSATATTEAEYNTQVTARFQTNVELTTEQSNAIDVEVKARLDAVLAAFPVLQRTALLACLDLKRGLIDPLITAINQAVTEALADTYKAFTDWQADVKTAFDQWVSVIADADVKAIVDLQISVNTQRAIQLAADASFYVTYEQQKQRESWLATSNAVYAYLVAVNANANDVAAKRTAAEAAVRASVIAAIDVRRAEAVKAQVAIEIEAIKDRLAQAKIDAEAAAQRAWADIRAALIAAYKDQINQLEEYRQRIAEYLAGIRCDASSATITLNTDTNNVNADVTIQVRGIKCYDSSRNDADLKALFCASLKAYFIAEGATATVDTYGCTIVNQKRALDQSGSSIDADMTASDPSSEPAPGTNASANVVACIFVLLFAMLFHF